MKKSKRAPTATGAIIETGDVMAAKLKAFAITWLNLRVGNCGRDSLKMAGKAFGVGVETARVWSKRVEVREAIQAHLASMEAKSGVSSARVLEEMMLIAYSDAKDYFEEAPDGSGGVEIRPKSITQMGRESKAIKKVIHRKKVRRDRDGGTETEHIYEYELWDKAGMLKELAEIKRLVLKPEGEKAENNVFIYLPDNGFSGKGMARRVSTIEEAEVQEVGATAAELGDEWAGLLGKEPGCDASNATVERVENVYK